MKSYTRPILSSSLLALCLGLAACSSTDDEKPTPDDDGGRSSGGSTGSGGGGNDEDGSTGSGGKGSGGGTTVPDGGPDGGPATLSGKAAVSDTQFIDSDTGDSAIRAVSNDDPSVANLVSSPSLIGGYLGNVPSGPDGGLVEDTLDFYKVTLAAGDVASLYIATNDDGSVPDFDIALLPTTATGIKDALDVSAGNEAIETVTAPAAGEYLLLVASNETSPNVFDSGRYTFNVGSGTSTNAVRNAKARTLSPAFDFVPGEAIVKFKPGTNANTATWKSIRATPVGRNDSVLGNFLVKLDSPALRSAVRFGIGATPSSTKLDKWSTLTAIKALRAQKNVLYAEPNYIRKIHAAPPNDSLWKLQWHYPQINLLEAWDHSKGDGVIVAVLDTGVKLTHPDFANSPTSNQFALKANGTIDGYDMISDPDIGADGDGRDPNPDDEGDLGLGSGESSWHGTHVSGTIAAATGNGIGCAGVAPNAKILPVRVLGVGGGTTSDIVNGILYAAGLDNASGAKPAKKADIINMSLGGRGLSQSTAEAIAKAREAGTIVIVSAGNDDTDASLYSPAGEEGVVTVGAIDYAKKRAPYSNYGNAVELVSPGGDESKDLNNDGVPDGVMSLILRGGKMGYTIYEGTSMAAPHAAGIAALMKSVYPGLTPDIFDTMIKKTGAGAIIQDLGTPGKDRDTGYGMLNANLAVLAALEAGTTPPPATPVLQVSATALDFGAVETELDLDIKNIGRGTLTVTSLAATGAGFSVAPTSGAAGTYVVKVDRTSLSDGPHTGSLAVTTNGGSATVSLRAVVGDTTVKGGDIGPLYVLLIPPDGTEAVAQAVTTAAEQYSWTLPDVAPGEYLLVAGTDIDDSGIVNDEGEAFGTFPLTSNPRNIVVPSDTSGLDFPVRFQFAVRAAAASTGWTPSKPGVKYRRLR